MTADRKPTGDQQPESDETAPAPAPARTEIPDPADEVPVPGAMSAAEIDERAQVVEKLRREQGMRVGDPPCEP